MRILHTGDWHIGNYPGPEVNGENARFLDVCKCLDSLVETAQEQKPDIIVVAGDVFHQAKVWSDRGLKENRTAVYYIRLLEKVAPVVIVRGTPNHDSEQQYRNLEDVFYGDDSVHIISEPLVRKVWSYSGEAVQIAALPGFDRGFYRAKHPGLSKEEENEVFTEELANLVVGLKASCETDTPTVLVSHFTIPGCNMESGQTQFFSQFEPVIYPATLQAADFDLVCFGHIHRPQTITEAKATYYCGAISAMNFNDEGQERGFYIHDIKKDGTTASLFRHTPTREFYTLRMEDADVAAFNADSIIPATVDDISDKIVRVIYNCTDENNKALNKTAMEQELYKMGAFWVQEITPEKITISVNRNGLSDESGPEENLIQYFEEKGYDSERIAEIVEAARPYIATAIENAVGGSKTGIFTPKRIEVKNYRNYHDEAFEYDGIRFCTINGENGAGKSSLFMDAMLDALYEETREGDLTGWICNDPDVRSGSIQFTFTIGEAEYRVTRTRQKSGKATLNISELVDGEWVDRSAEKFKETQAIIRETVGMDSLTLKACGLIMQDQYGLFLQADKETRMGILGNILGLAIYEKMESAAADSLTNRNREIRTINERVTAVLGTLPDEEILALNISEAEQKAKDIEAELEKKRGEVDSTKVRLNTKLEAAQRAVKIQGQIASLTSKKDIAISAKASQTLVKNGAESTIAQEPEILAGVKEYEELCEQEKQVISARDRRNDLLSQRQKKSTDISSYSAEIDITVEDRKAEEARLATLKVKLSREPELASKHDEYLRTQEAITEMRRLFEERATLERDHSNAYSTLQKVQSEWKLKQTTIDAEVRTLEQRVALLENSGCPDTEKATCKFLAEAIEARETLPAKRAEAEATRKAMQEAVEKAQEAVNFATKALEDNNYTPEEMRRLNGILEDLREYEEIYSTLDSLKSQAEDSERTIGKLIHRSESLRTQKQTAEADLKDIEDKLKYAEFAAKEYDDLALKIVAARVWLEKEKSLPVAKERLSTATQRIAELEEELAQIEIELAEKQAELATEQLTATGSEELQRTVKAAQAVIDDLSMQKEQNAMRLGALQEQAKKADEAKQSVKELQAKAVEIGKLAAIDDDLKKAFSQDGIPHNVIRSLIPTFEATATAILGQMSGGKMSVELITEKVLKSNNKKEVTTLDIVINDCNTGRLPYMSRSGGERVKSALSVILALSEIKSTKAGVQLGFLFIDEPPFLDAQGVQAYCDALEAIQSRYSNLKIMAITHDPTMKSRFPQSVDVIKTAEGSKVIYG